MAEPVTQKPISPTFACCDGAAGQNTGLTGIASHIRRLQLLTLGWMLVECGLALAAAAQARSPVLLAFGADSFVELLSAAIVLLQFTSRWRIEERRAAQLAGALLYVLAVLVAATSALALTQAVRPQTSWLGMGVTIAALVLMPLLSRAKRIAGKRAGNAALLADAVQSATCAYLAAITLAGLALNAVFHLSWLDPVAALVAVPILVIEARRARRGQPCCG